MTQGDPQTQKSAAAARMKHQGHYVDLQIQRAIERGDFDNLPGAGKPIPDLGKPDDRDWWLKKLIERERVTGVIPEALQLRKDDAALDQRLDALHNERSVREQLESFNARIVSARRQLLGGPPVITPLRDVEAEVAHWQERRRR